MQGFAQSVETNKAPRYTSTRNGDDPVSFEHAVRQGLAADGGLYLPDHIPSLPARWREADALPDLATQVLAPWLQDKVDPDALRTLLADALAFPIPLIELEGEGWDNIYVLELFHGPTLSFKDVGARTMARLLAHFQTDDEPDLSILVATSGDTGSAVADGFAGQPGIRVVLLYPKGQVSPVQERQLIVRRTGVQALAVEGTFDDCQRLVKAAFADSELDHVALSSANSINVGRLVPQMLYYIWAVQQGGLDEVVFCVPSGNLGNLTAGVMASLAGLPVRRFIAAHNANDFFPRHLGGEDIAPGDSVRTLSNAMDVGAPSNFERLRALLSEKEARERIWATSVTDEETLRSMQAVQEATGYVADPHTAVGLEAVRRYRRTTGDTPPLVVLSTAHPAKFPETVVQALGNEPEVPPRLARYWEEETHVTTIAPTLEALRDVLMH